MLGTPLVYDLMRILSILCYTCGSFGGGCVLCLWVFFDDDAVCLGFILILKGVWRLLGGGGGVKEEKCGLDTLESI